MSVEIVPCITVETPEEYKASVERLQTFAKRVHIDISDGEFAPRALLGPDQLWWPKEWTVDIHAMVSSPIDYVDRLTSLQPNLITFHVETGTNMAPIIERVKMAGVRAGIALLKTTVPSSIAELIKMVDHVMVFSGNLGHYGGEASMMQTEKVRLIRAISPDVEISWDGGAALNNVFAIAQSGVNVINAGGAIANSEQPSQAYATLLAEANRQGII